MRSKQIKVAVAVLTVVAVAVVALQARAYFSREWILPVPLAQSDFARQGIVEPATVAVTASVAGRVSRIMVKAGDAVKAGQPLVELTNPSVTSQLELARAELTAATAPFGPYAIRTPIAGTVLKVYRTAGSVAPAGQPVLAVGDPNKLTVSVPTTGLSRLPVPGQLAWVYSTLASTVTAKVTAVEAGHIIVSLPAGCGLHLDEPVLVRFDPAEPILLAPGVVTADVVVLPAAQDGRLSYVAPEGSAVTAGQQVATVDRAAVPDAASGLRAAQARENLRAAQAAADGLIVRAPVDGVVESLGVELGNELASGSTVAQVGNPGALHITVRVQQDHADLWQRGRTVTVVSSAFESQEQVIRTFEASNDIAVTITAPNGVVQGQTVLVLPADVRCVVVPAAAIEWVGRKSWVKTLSFGVLRKLEVHVAAKIADWAIVTGVGSRQRIAMPR